MSDTNMMAPRVWGAALLAAVLAMPAVGRATSKGPDAGGYTATDETVYSFVDIAGAGGGAAVLAGADDDLAALVLPFPFSFYGQLFDTVCVSTNGALYFVPGAEACAGFNDFVNADLSATVPPGDRPAAFPYWSDLSFQVPGAGGVYYQTLGAPGSRRFVVQWHNAFPQGSPNPVTFQVVLGEASRDLRFQYRTVDLGPGNPASKGADATVGIRNAGAPDNGQHIQWSVGASVIADESALLFSAAGGQPPVTSARTAGLEGRNGWHRRPVRVILSATDPDDAVAGTFYSLDGGAPVRYSTPFEVSGDGPHSVEFFSRDAAGNQEPPRLLRVSIDGTGPSLTLTAVPASAPGQPLRLRLAGRVTDTVSGVDPASAVYTVLGPDGRAAVRAPLVLADDGTYVREIDLGPAGRGDRELHYTVAVEAADVAGNPAGERVTVTIPRERR